MERIAIDIYPDDDGRHCGNCNEREFLNDFARNAHFTCRQGFAATQNCTVRGEDCLKRRVPNETS